MNTHEAVKSLLETSATFRAISRGLEPHVIITSSVVMIMTAIAEANPRERKALVKLMDESLSDCRKRLERDYL